MFERHRTIPPTNGTAINQEWPSTRLGAAPLGAHQVMTETQVPTRVGVGWFPRLREVGR